LKFFKKPSRDRVIVIEGEKVETIPVVYHDSETIDTPYQVFPRSDAKVKFDPNGGVVFLINCDLNYLQETEHLKRVEESIAIRNIFNFQDQSRQLNIPFIIMCVILVLVILMLR